MDDKKTIIAQIVEVEERLFLAVPAAGRPACRENLEGFRLHRRVQFLPWSVATLKSYLNDILRAEIGGKNPMTLKYSRMDGALEAMSENPLIDKIVKEFVLWQKELFREIPTIMAGSRPVELKEGQPDVTDFTTYLRGELETYSDSTLSLLWEDVQRAVLAGESMSRETYEALAVANGYSSLAATERILRTRQGA